jgi:uncharacterized damage-inducible protein DinB
LGFLTVPVVVLPGKRPIPGFNAKELGNAIGIADRSSRQSLEGVLESFDGVLVAVLAATAQLENADLNLKMPNRDRDLRGLIHDIFYKALTWAPEHGQASRRDADKQKEEAARYRDVVSLLRYAEASRGALRERFGPDRMDYDRVIETADGPMTLAEAVTWIADHSAHHLRQVYWLMEEHLGIKPADPLDVTSLRGITLQEHLW